MKVLEENDELLNTDILAMMSQGYKIKQIAIPVERKRSFACNIERRQEGVYVTAYAAGRTRLEAYLECVRRIIKAEAELSQNIATSD